MILAGVITNVLGMYLIKMKMNALGAMDVSSFKPAIGYFFALAKSPVALTGVVLFMIAPVPFAIALSRMELSTAYPLSIAMSCLIIVPLTFVFFGEGVSPNKIVAILMIIASLYFMYRT
jgi:multidrug transporter EmrE-like cation transporter